MESDDFRVGVYVDGFNLYYGGRSLFGRGASGWKWLDLRKLSERIIEQQCAWAAPDFLKIVYCSARVSGAEDPQKEIDQSIYIRALRESGSVDHFEFGSFRHRISYAPLAIQGKKNRPKIFSPTPPILIQTNAQDFIHDSRFIATIARWEEKGSDVNVASHLLIDCMSNRIDAAIVISNDSDLRLPIEKVVDQIPIGVINPSKNPTAGALRKLKGHNDQVFFYQLKQDDYLNCQLSYRDVRKPKDW